MDDRVESSFTACLKAFYAGSEAARNELLRRTQERMRWHVSRQLDRFPHLRRWENTDSVIQGILIRMDRALGRLAFESSQAFLCLAAVQMRRELLDLARHYRRVHARHQTPGPDPDNPGPGVETQPAPEGEPGELLVWEEFHRLVEQLDVRERGVVDLLWYHGMSKEEVAAELGCSVRTVRRHWQNARLRLYDALDGEFPF